jgi:hypothetical protein
MVKVHQDGKTQAITHLVTPLLHRVIRRQPTQVFANSHAPLIHMARKDRIWIELHRPDNDRRKVFPKV